MDTLATASFHSPVSIPQQTAAHSPHDTNRSPQYPAHGHRHIPHHPRHAHTHTLHNPTYLTELTEPTQTSLRASDAPTLHTTRVLSHTLHSTRRLPGTHYVSRLSPFLQCNSTCITPIGPHMAPHTAPSGHHATGHPAIRLLTGGPHQQPPVPSLACSSLCQRLSGPAKIVRRLMMCLKRGGSRGEEDTIWKIFPGFESKRVIFDLFVIYL